MPDEAEPKRARLVSTCSPAMGEFTATFADAQGITMSELIRLALSAYMEYELSPADADAPKPAKKQKKAKDPNAPSKRAQLVATAMAQARANNAERQAAIARQLAEGQPI